MKTSTYLSLALCLGLGGAFRAPVPALAENYCGQTLTEDAILTEDQNCKDGGIVVIGATLDLNGFDVVGDGDLHGIGLTLDNTTVLGKPADLSRISGFWVGVEMRRGECVLRFARVVENYAGVRMNGYVAALLDHNIISNNREFGVRMSGSECHLMSREDKLRDNLRGGFELSLTDDRTTAELLRPRVLGGGAGIRILGARPGSVTLGAPKVARTRTEGFLLESCTDAIRYAGSPLRATDCEGAGIRIEQSEALDIRWARAKRNGFGIVIGGGSTGNHVQECKALDSTAYDMMDVNPDCDDNVWTQNKFETANRDCIE